MNISRALIATTINTHYNHLKNKIIKKLLFTRIAQKNKRNKKQKEQEDKITKASRKSKKFAHKEKNNTKYKKKSG